jgi:hypothetical protein
MQILIADLHEDAAGIGEEFAGHRQAVAQVGEVRVDAERPGVAVRLDHFRFAGEVLFTVLHVTLAELRLEVRGELDAVGRVEIDHLHLAREVFAPGEAGHDLQRIAEDHAVRPVHVVLIELHGFRIVVLRIGKEIALDILACQHAQDGLRGDALVHVQGDRLDLEPRLLALAAPFQPRLVPAQRVREHLRLVRRKRPLPGNRQQLGQLVRRCGVRRRAQHRRQVRVVFVAELGRLLNDALRFQPGWRNVLALGGILEGSNGIARMCRRSSVSLSLVQHGADLAIVRSRRIRLLRKAVTLDPALGGE